jgi:hypothetical protein
MDLLSWFSSSSSLLRTTRNLGDLTILLLFTKGKSMRLGFVYSMVPWLIQVEQGFFYEIMSTRKLEDQS